VRSGGDFGFAVSWEFYPDNATMLCLSQEVRDKLFGNGCSVCYSS